MTLKTTLIALALGVVAAGGVAGAASAQDGGGTGSKGVYAHPRKAEVMARVVHQKREIKAEMRRGEISPAKAHRMLAADRRVAREVRHHRALTVAEQRRLNHQENRIHRHLNG
jgi:hypothetical protein